MKNYRRDLPGYGDEATWPPYSGHPLDPRAPSWEDQISIVEAQWDLADKRVKEDVAWLYEAFAECDKGTLVELWISVINQDLPLAGEIVTEILSYILPDEDDARESLQEHGAARWYGRPGVREE